ncbi:MAG TPA: TonB-dependent receptor [Blastocatellia bacterium]|nr:TonB-dependent receptor [Blastocatellia bacterium]
MKDNGDSKPNLSRLRHRPIGPEPGRACLFVVWLGVLCVTVAAQQRISGTVTERNSQHPLAATIKLGSDLLAEERVTTPDSEGRFTFPGLSPGRYTVSATADNYYSEEITVVVAPRATCQITFELDPLARVNEQVTVRAEARLIDETQAATVATIDRGQIQQLPAARRTQLAEIVTPFVASAVGGHDNLVHLRGNELSLNTFVNGVSFFDNPHQLFTPGLSPDIIQSVNVITGGFPAEFGNRFGGILDIVTRSGFDANNHGSITGSLGNYLRDNASFNFGGHDEKFGYFLFGQAFQSDRFLNTPEAARFHDRGNGSRSFVQLDYRPGSNDFFKVALTGDGTNFELPNATEDELRGRDFFQRNREQSAVLAWDHAFSASSAVSTSLYERFTSARLVPTTDLESIQAGGIRNDLTLGVKSDYSLFIGSTHSIKTGVDLMLLRLREDFSFDPRENEIEVGQFDFRGRETGGQASLYFQDQIRPFRNLTANLGLRYDQYSTVLSGHAFSPRVNLAYAMQGAHTVLHFAYNRFFSPPPIENLLLSAALGFEGKMPQISRSNHFEAGATHSIKDRMVVRLTGYWRSDKNSFETTELANVRIFAPTTFARGKAYGLELSAQLAEIDRLGLSGYFSYTAQRAFQTGPVSGGFTVEEVEPGQRGPAAFDQIHTAVAGLTWRERHSGFWASTLLEYGSGTPASLPNAEGEETSVRLPEHFVANFYFGVDLLSKERHSVSIQLNIENANDRVFRIAKESEFTPVQFSPPRFLSGSLTFHF